MASQPERKLSNWADSDKLAASLAALSCIETKSRTMELDESQPPTPEDSGIPFNFQVIAPGIYRSSYPSAAHFERLQDLELKTVITLVETMTLEYANFISSNGIIHHHIPLLPNKQEGIFSNSETANKILGVMLDPENYPLMVHCNKGRHRTGCMSACFRKITGWTMEAIVTEYEKFAAPKPRQLDRDFIQRYDAAVLKPIAMERGYVGGVYRQPATESTKSSEYTNNTMETTTTTESDQPPNDYQEKVFKQNAALLESARLWSHR